MRCPETREFPVEVLDEIFCRPLFLESELPVLRVDGFYLYSLGYYIHPVSEIAADSPFEKWGIALLIAQGQVETLLEQSVFRLQASKNAGYRLLAAIKSLTADMNRTTPINFYEAYQVTQALTEFEHVLNAELGVMN